MSSAGVIEASPPPRAPVVAAKLRLPRLRTGELRRDRLIDALVGADVPVVVVRAPAGFGKTTALRQWVEVDPRPAAWVSLDPADNDPVRLLRHVVRALDGVTPLPEVEERLAVEPPPVTSALPVLATALADAAPLVLVLDDVHVVEHDGATHLLEWLVGVLPPGSALALAGRALPPMRLTRHVAGDDALVLRWDDLAFTGPELRAVVAGALPDLAPDEVTRLHERTEGWPAGLQLALLAARAAPAPSPVLADLPYQAAELAAYVNEELLRQLAPEVRAFLLRTSVLDRLSPALCDAVLERRDSGPVLRQLAASDNLFLVTHEDEPEWSRYHHLFAELLLAELRAEAPHEEAGLRRRAAGWLAEHGDPDGAVAQALAAADWDLAAAVAHRHAPARLQAGEVATLARWLAAFPATEARRSPLLMLLHGWVDFVEGRPDDVRRWLDRVAVADWEGPLPDGSASLAVAHASLAMFHAGGGVTQTAADARQVREAGPDGSPWWGTAWLFEAHAVTLADPDADAVALLGDAEFASRGDPVTHLVCLAHLAWARFRAGDVAGATAAASSAYAGLRARHLESYGLAVMVHAVHAYASARQGRRDEATAAADQALRLVEAMSGAVPRAQCQIRLVLAEAALVAGDGARARDLVDAAEPYLAEEPDAVVLRDQLDALRERLAERRRRESAVSVHGLTGAELRVLAQLPSHRSLQEIGRELYISRNTVKTHAVAIYRKLGVSGRSAAVDRARDLGLLDTGITDR